MYSDNILLQSTTVQSCKLELTCDSFGVRTLLVIWTGHFPLPVDCSCPCVLIFGLADAVAACVGFSQCTCIIPKLCTCSIKRTRSLLMESFIDFSGFTKDLFVFSEILTENVPNWSNKKRR